MVAHTTPSTRPALWTPVGNGNHDLRWLRIAQCLYRREHACAGGQTVIDDNDRLAGIGGRRRGSGLAPKQFLTSRLAMSRSCRGAIRRPRTIVIDHDAPLASAPPCELVMPRGTKFAHDEGV